MIDNEHILDERLTAFLDGELGAAACEELALAIEADMVLQQRITNLQFDQNSLLSAYGSLQAPDMIHQIALNDQFDQKETRERSWGFGTMLIAASALIAAFVIGMFSNELGVGFRESSGQQIAINAKLGWRQSVASYMALYTKSTLDRIPFSEQSNQNSLSHLSGDLELALIADHIAVDELQFRRGQILDLGGKPLVQLAYLDHGTTPVAFCIIKGSKGKKSMQFEQRNGMAIAHWASENHGFMVIGNLPATRIEAIARTLSVNF